MMLNTMRRKQEVLNDNPAQNIEILQNLSLVMVLRKYKQI